MVLPCDLEPTAEAATAAAACWESRIRNGDLAGNVGERTGGGDDDEWL